MISSSNKENLWHPPLVRSRSQPLSLLVLLQVVVLLVLSSIDAKSMQLTSISVILLYIDKEIV